MENQPEHVGIWLGLSKIGVITALINTNLRSNPLLHSIKVANSKYVIYSSSLIDAIKSIENELDKEIGLIVNLDNNDVASRFENSLALNSALKNISDELVTPSEPVLNSGNLKIFLNFN